MAIFIIILNRFAVMFISSTRKIFFIFLMTLFAFSVKAQQVHFIYLQTDNGQPFYAKLNNKLVSSSAEGYIILPNITDGVYSLIVGFPRNEFPETNFTIKVDNNNEGYILKNFDEKGWELFNLQTLALTEGTKVKPVAVTVKKDEDTFTKMLAGVVKDSSILQDHGVAIAPVKKVDTSTVINIDTLTATNNTNNPSIQKTDSTTVKTLNNTIESSVPKIDSTSVTVIDHTNNTSLTKTDSLSENKADSTVVVKVNSPVSKISSKQDNQGLQMIYEDKNDSSTDTVKIFMPARNETDSINKKNVVGENKNPDSSSVAATLQLTITPTVIKPKTDTSIQEATSKNDGNLNRDTLSLNKTESSQVTPSTAMNDSLEEIKKSSVANNAEEKTDSIKEEPDMQTELTKENKDSSISNNKNNITDVKITDVAPEKPAPITGDNMDQNNKVKNDDSTGSKIVVLPKVVTKSWVNSDCKDFATNSDFLKLRKKMAAENGIDNMLKVARKYFKLTCFSTEQIRNLSYLFLTDEGKYMFFDEAYAFTSDSNQYETLQSQFTDPYYLNRFKAMIRK